MKRLLKTIRGGFLLTSTRGKVILITSAISNILLSIIDAAALFLLAKSLSSKQESYLNAAALQSDISVVAWVLALFILRSVLATATNWLAVMMLAREQTRIGDQIFDRLLDVRAYRIANHDSLYFNAVERGPEFLIMTLTNAAFFLTEVLTAGVIFGIFVYFEPLTAVLSVAYFASIVVLQHYSLARRSGEAGENVVSYRNHVYQMLGDSSRLRSILTPESLDSLKATFSASLQHLSVAKARNFALSSVPRHLLEVTFGLGMVIVGLAVYWGSGAEKAVASIGLFIGVGFRLMPTVNRIQSLALTMLAHVPIAEYALTDFESKSIDTRSSISDDNYVLKLSNVGFRFPDSNNHEILTAINLVIERGKQYAIVGASGAGKTTLAHILLGLEFPTSGLITRASSIRAAYVSQDTHLAHASLAENVALLWDRDQVNLARASSALRMAGLEKMNNHLDDPRPLLNESVSGGEKQRIGLARAFYADANFIVLDEITSSLDAMTETALVAAIGQLRGDVTTVLIAHRPTTIQRADMIFFIQRGSLVGSGTFAELSASLPQFQKMVALAQIQM